MRLGRKHLSRLGWLFGSMLERRWIILALLYKNDKARESWALKANFIAGWINGLIVRPSHGPRMSKVCNYWLREHSPRFLLYRWCVWVICSIQRHRKKICESPQPLRTDIETLACSDYLAIQACNDLSLSKQNTTEMVFCKIVAGHVELEPLTDQAQQG